jgi:hypothetical protein
MIVLDYGTVASAKKNDDGTISFYGRIAVAERPYKYLNSDGSTRIEKISRQDLFDPNSIDTIKLQVITNGHSSTIVNPDNYKQVASGTTGNLVINGADNNFLGIVGKLQSKDAIDAFNSGVRQLSPGYFRSLTNVDGQLYQNDRRYYELALVERARGGHDVKIKDSVTDSVDSNVSYFDPLQIDDDLIKFWSNTDGINDNLINSIFNINHQKEKVNLPMTIVSCRLNGKTIKVEDSDVSVITDADSTICAAAEVKSKLDAAIKDNAELKANIKITNEQLSKANETLGNKDSIIDAAVKQAIAENQKLRKDNDVFAKHDINVDSSLLDSNDNNGFKKAVVLSVYGNEYNNDSDINITYDATVKAYSKLAVIPNNDAIPNLNLSSTGVGGQVASLTSSGGVESLINGVGGFSGGLPPDDAAHGWY